MKIWYTKSACFSECESPIELIDDNKMEKILTSKNLSKNLNSILEEANTDFCISNEDEIIAEIEADALTA